jgi:hypothetical protein
MSQVAAGVAIIGLALLTFFQFPGHTWLQQDTQIYAPILEHLRDPDALNRDLVVQYPHVSFTLYDELTIGLRQATGHDFEHVLGAEQLVCRALGIWGIYLLATACGLDLWAALMVASIFSLGATIAGPSVLTFEYEPTPRALAMPMLFCALGLASWKRFTAAGVVAAAAFLIHPPSSVPFWLVLLWISRVEWRRTFPAWIALVCAVIALSIAAHMQPGLREQQEFFTRLTPRQEAVQRMRAAYNWISIWGPSLVPQYVVLYGMGLVAFVRVKECLTPELRAISLILPAIGMLSMPLSYVLLERLKWSLVPQLQPMRALLFVTAFAVILASMAALRAMHVAEAVVWFALVFYIPMRVEFFDAPTLRMVLTTVGFAAFAAVALRLTRPSLLIAGALAFFALPGIARVSLYPNLHTPEIADLSRWARDNTPRGAMFLFPDAGHLLYPGIFRVSALRAVYVDWKSGGQVNYLKDFAEEWSTRWEMVNRTGYGADALPRYRSVGVDYVVLQHDHKPAGTEPVYGNSQYAVYRTTD